jgi:dTDP-4-amino-4,6-dideoxygalactose transaminase
VTADPSLLDALPALDPLAWGAWPMSSPAVEGAVLSVLRSGRWAISGMNAGKDSQERGFARLFGEYVGVPSVAATASGSSALVVALQAAGIGYGDEVLVPGLAWVACASAVARIGAVPVLVDIDPEIYAMDARVAESLVGPRTAAILVTHLASTVADLDAFEDLATRHGLAVVEDASQAHGAMWRGRRVGSYGETAAFSFQSSKLLTAGEGGAAVSRRTDMAGTLQQLRADGRVWADRTAEGFPDLAPGDGQQGHNHCMTEMQSAILTASLPDLDAQHDTRLAGVSRLEGLLEGVDGIQTVRRRGDSRVDRETFWHLPLRIDPEAFGGASAEQVRALLSRLVGLFLEPVGAPMTEHPLYRPRLYRRFPPDHVARLTAPQGDLPGAREFSRTTFTMPHHALLAPVEVLDGFVERVVLLQRLLGSRSIA